MEWIKVDKRPFFNRNRTSDVVFIKKGIVNIGKRYEAEGMGGHSFDIVFNESDGSKETAIWKLDTYNLHGLTPLVSICIELMKKGFNVSGDRDLGIYMYDGMVNTDQLDMLSSVGQNGSPVCFLSDDVLLVYLRCRETFHYQRSVEVKKVYEALSQKFIIRSFEPFNNQEPLYYNNSVPYGYFITLKKLKS